jgi:hypothetical protein
MRKNIFEGMQRFIAASFIAAACLLASGSQVTPAQASVDETALLPEITTFAVSPVSIGSGSSATLTWAVKNATSISIDHDIGGVSGEGQVQVNPLFTTTYKMTAMNGAGVRSRYITLAVSFDRYSENNDNTVNCDPVTGRNASVDMAWEQLCLSKQYQVQIARDAGFTLKVYDSGIMQPADVTSPAFWYPPGNLEAGHTYYWRVRTRQAATGQYMVSPWSDPQAFTVKPGYAVRSEYYGVEALTPVNGTTGCPVNPVSFSWSGYPNTTKYRFILAKDAGLQNIVVEAFTTSTSFALTGSLEYDMSYFWQVTAVEPVPSDPSSIFTFHTRLAPKPETAQSGAASSAIPLWALAVMIAGVLLIGITVFLIIRVRRAI